MAGKSEEQILKEREEIRKEIIEKYKKTYDRILFIPSYFRRGNEKPLRSLGESIKALSDADIAVFAKGWETARGCVIEHEACEKYGIGLIEL